MNSKTANLIALELGILIVILAWLAFSRFPTIHHRAVTEEQARTTDSFTSVAPVFESRNQRPDAAKNAADLLPAQPGDEELPSTVQQYDQEIATAPYPGSGLTDDLIAGGSPYYNEMESEPVVTPPDYLAPPVYQIVEYVQPTQIFILSSRRFVMNRHRSVPHCGGVPTIITHRHPGAAGPRATVPSPNVPPSRTGGGLVSRRTTNTRSSQSVQGLRVNWNR